MLLWTLFVVNVIRDSSCRRCRLGDKTQDANPMFKVTHGTSNRALDRTSERRSAFGGTPASMHTFIQQINLHNNFTMATTR